MFARSDLWQITKILPHKPREMCVCVWRVVPKYQNVSKNLYGKHSSDDERIECPNAVYRNITMLTKPTNKE